MYDAKRKSSPSMMSLQANIAFIQMLPTLHKLAKLVSEEKDLNPCRQPQLMFLSPDRDKLEEGFKLRLPEVGRVVDVANSPDADTSKIVFLTEPKYSGEVVTVGIQAYNAMGERVVEGFFAHKVSEWIVTVIEKRKENASVGSGFPDQNSVKENFQSYPVVESSGQFVVVHRLQPHTTAVEVSCLLGHTCLPGTITCVGLCPGFRLDAQKSSKELVIADTMKTVSSPKASGSALFAFATSDFGHAPFTLEGTVEGEAGRNEQGKPLESGVYIGIRHHGENDERNLCAFNFLRQKENKFAFRFKFEGSIKNNSSSTPWKKFKVYRGVLQKPGFTLQADADVECFPGINIPFIAFRNVKATVTVTKP